MTPNAEIKPELHSMRALEWLHQADLKETNVQTYVGDISAPLSKEKRIALLKFVRKEQRLWRKKMVPPYLLPVLSVHLSLPY